MAYFRQCFPSDMQITTIKELSRALAAHPPYEIPVSSIKIKHLHCEVGYAMVNDMFYMQCFVTLVLTKSIAVHICWIFLPGAFSTFLLPPFLIYSNSLLLFQSYTNIFRYFCHILISSISVCQVPKSEVFYSLNATIVGLAVDSEYSESFPDCMGLGKLLQLDSHTCFVILSVLYPSKKILPVLLLFSGQILVSFV